MGKVDHLKEKEIYKTPRSLSNSSVRTFWLYFYRKNRNLISEIEFYCYRISYKINRRDLQQKNIWDKWWLTKQKSLSKKTWGLQQRSMNSCDCTKKKLWNAKNSSSSCQMRQTSTWHKTILNMITDSVFSGLDQILFIH